MAEVRALSTRATIPPSRFVNIYNWGNFRGDPVALMEQYYDAFLYVANWGSHQLMLRLPRNALDQETASRYRVDEEAFSMHSTGEHVILAFDSDTEEPEDWDEGEGWLATLVLLRSDIAAGDLRTLYLSWLLRVQQEVLDNDMVEPELPPGLGGLSASLQALAEFLRIDQDLLQAAAESSSARPQVTPRPMKPVDGYAPSRAVKRMTCSFGLPVAACCPFRQRYAVASENQAHLEAPAGRQYRAAGWGTCWREASVSAKSEPAGKPRNGSASGGSRLLPGLPTWTTWPDGKMSCGAGSKPSLPPKGELGMPRQ